jgi:hypothetical protein
MRAPLQSLFKHHPYFHYSEKKADVDQIMTELRNHPGRGLLKQIFNQTHIPYTTLRSWREKGLVDPQYSPAQPRSCEPCMLLPVDLEEEIANYLRFHYIVPGIFCTRRIAQSVALQFITERVVSHQLSQTILNGKFSRKWIYRFMKRNHLSFRKVRGKRRPTPTESVKVRFRQILSAAIDEYGKDHIYNMDESNWKLNELPSTTLAEVGSEVVKGFIAGNVKKSFSIIATVSADGNKLPLWIIAKGKTMVCQRGFGEIKAPNIITHSENGWSNEPVLLQYLKWLRRENIKQPFCLVWDSFVAHKTEAINSYCTNKRIRVIMIPAGCTDELQPLDRRIFGYLKAKARCHWLNWYTSNLQTSMKTDQSVKKLFSCLEQITNENIIKAWNLVLNEDESSSDDSLDEDSEDDEYVLPPTDPPSII